MQACKNSQCFIELDGGGVAPTTPINQEKGEGLLKNMS